MIISFKKKSINHFISSMLYIRSKHFGKNKKKRKQKNKSEENSYREDNIMEAFHMLFQQWVRKLDQFINFNV